jgi:hypothetical protein
VEQEPFDKEANPVLQDLDIFLEYQVRRGKILKYSTEGKSTKRINKDVVALFCEFALIFHYRILDITVEQNFSEFSTKFLDLCSFTLLKELRLLFPFACPVSSWRYEAFLV